MKILLIGATGRTGKLVLKTALEMGHSVHCLARKVGRIPAQNGLTIFEGNPTNPMDMQGAMQGCDAVISVLNISGTSDFPWAKLRTPKIYLSDVMRVLIPIAEKQHIHKVSICSAWGVTETRNDIPMWFKWFIDNSNIGVAYQDHEKQEQILIKSHLNWTILRPVGLTNSKKQEAIQETLHHEPKPSLLISRQSVANYLINSLQNDQITGQKVVISKKL